jgi:hypothetical protein
MSELSYVMSNAELQDAIIHTDAMIRRCPQGAERMRELKSHLSLLLDAQHSRATMLKEIKP